MIKLNRAAIRDKIHACWIGKNIGGTMGTPYEGQREIHDIQGFSTPANVVLPNDDLDLQLVWLRAVEQHGPLAVNAALLGEYWVSFIPPHWNEYGIGKNNLRAGLLPPLSGEYKNDHWKNSNGAWIRTEIWACMAPGCPDLAIKYAYEDACVDHGAGEGTYAAMFVAAMESAAFVEHDIRRLIDIGLSKIPKDCHTARSIRLLLDCYEQGIDWKEARNRIVRDNEDLGWFQAPANVSYAMLGMLYGEGDFKKSMILAINCGDDTDCTGATLGSLFGILNGTAGIPTDWSEHIGENIVTVAVNRGALSGIPANCSELTDRVMRMIPVMLCSHNAPVSLTDDPDNIPETDTVCFGDTKVAEKLWAIPGRSVPYYFVWGSCRVIFTDQPEINPNGTVHIRLQIHNEINEPKYLNLRWHLPEGWTVSGSRKNYVLDSQASLELPIEIHASENTETINRVILEITAPGRPTVGLIPITLIG